MRKVRSPGKGQAKREDNSPRPSGQEINSVAAIGQDIETPQLFRLAPWRCGSFTAPRSLIIFCLGYAAALIFLVLGPYVNFGYAGLLDSWIYTGFFMNSSYLLRQYGLPYYFSRLPWVIPGIVAFKIATPAVASVLLNAAIVSSSAVSLYWIVRWYYGHIPALLTSIALATNLYFIYTVMWDYPDGPAIAYAFVALSCYLRPHGNRAANSVLAAACLALCGFTNMAAAGMILAMLVIPFWQHRRSLKELIAEGVYIAIGIFVVAFPLCFVSKLVLGKYMFFKPQIDETIWELSRPGFLSRMWGTGLDFLHQAYRLFLPAFLLAMCGVLLVARRIRGIAWPSYLFAGIYCALIALQEFKMHAVALRVAYVSSYMVVPLFLLFGAVIGEVWARAEPGGTWTIRLGRPSRGTIQLGFRSVAATFVAVFAIALPFLMDRFASALASSGRRAGIEAIFRTDARTVWIEMAVLGAATIVVVMCSLGRGTTTAALASVMILATIFVGPAYDPAVQYPKAPENTDTFRALIDVQNLLMASVPQERHLRFWYDTDEHLAPLFDSAASLYLWGYFDLTKELPVAPVDTVKSYITPNTTIVHLVSQPARISERSKLLRDRGVSVANQRLWTVRAGGGAQFYIVLEDVVEMTNVH